MISFELAPDSFGAGAAVTERPGGVSAPPYASLNLGRSVEDDPVGVSENERRTLASLGLGDRVARLRLEHGAKVLEVGAPGLHGPADAIFTSDPSLVLWLTVADCVPIAFDAGSWRALAHCGWRGTALGLAEATVRALHARAGARPEELRVWIGPAIGGCCYEVGPEVAERFRPGSLVLGPSGTTRLDLRVELAHRLESAGVPPTQISISTSCTACEEQRFFSHRRDGFPTGRMAALVWSRRQARTPASSSS